MFVLQCYVGENKALCFALNSYVINKGMLYLVFDCFMCINVI